MQRLSERWLRRVLMVLYERREATRAEIVRATRLNVASVSFAVRHLLAHGLVQRGSGLHNSIGRKPDQLKLNPEAGYFLALDLEGTRIRFALTNFLGDIRCRWEIPFAFGSTLDTETMARGLKALLAALTPPEQTRVFALGVCYTGIIDREGRVSAVNLGWSRFPLREHLERIVDIPVYLGSESAVKLMAERWLGLARGRNHCVFINVANGVGCAVLSGGHLISGRDGAAGELGHITIDPNAPDRCACGRQGCLEAIVSSPNLVRQYDEKLGRNSGPLYGERVIEIFERARQGDEAALAVVTRAGYYLGLAIANLIQLFNPELIILGGDLVYASDLFLGQIERVLACALPPLVRESLEIRASALGVDIGLIGAAALAFHNAVRERPVLQRICMLKPPAGSTRRPTRSVDAYLP